MEGRARQAGSGKTQATGQTVVKTTPFTVPSNGVVLHTVKPDFAHVAAFINVVMAAYPDFESMKHPDEKAAVELQISAKLLDYFARYCVKLTKEQVIAGARVVAKSYKDVGYTKMPKGKELIGKVVLIAHCPTQDDRRALLAHMSVLSGLVKFMNEDGQNATKRVLEA